MSEQDSSSQPAQHIRETFELLRTLLGKLPNQLTYWDNATLIDVQDALRRMEKLFVANTQMFEKTFAALSQQNTRLWEEITAVAAENATMRATLEGALPKASVRMDLAKQRVEAVLNDRRGYHVDALDVETRDAFLRALVEAVLVEMSA